MGSNVFRRLKMPDQVRHDGGRHSGVRDLKCESVFRFSVN